MEMRHAFVALATVAALAGCARSEQPVTLNSEPAKPVATFAYQAGNIDRGVDCETGNTVYRFSSGTAAVAPTEVSAAGLRAICKSANITPGF